MEILILLAFLLLVIYGGKIIIGCVVLVDRLRGVLLYNRAVTKTNLSATFIISDIYTTAKQQFNNARDKLLCLIVDGAEKRLIFTQALRNFRMSSSDKIVLLFENIEQCKLNANIRKKLIYDDDWPKGLKYYVYEIESFDFIYEDKSDVFNPLNGEYNIQIESNAYYQSFNNYAAYKSNIFKFIDKVID